jgi:hypothetical protein
MRLNDMYWFLNNNKRLKVSVVSQTYSPREIHSNLAPDA